MTAPIQNILESFEPRTYSIFSNVEDRKAFEQGIGLVIVRFPSFIFLKYDWPIIKLKLRHSKMVETKEVQNISFIEH